MVDDGIATYETRVRDEAVGRLEAYACGTVSFSVTTAASTF